VCFTCFKITFSAQHPYKILSFSLSVLNTHTHTNEYLSDWVKEFVVPHNYRDLKRKPF